MTQAAMTHSKHHVNSLLLVIFFVAVLLRVTTAVFIMGNEIQPLPGIFDQLSYDALANRLLAGYGFSFDTFSWPYASPDQPTAFWSFLYTIYLAVIYAVFGPEPIVARVIQATIVGVLTPFLTYRIAQFVFGERVALISASLTAIYIYFVYYASALMTEPFYIVCILWTLECSLRLTVTQQTRRWIWLELGIALGFAVLLRQVYLPFVPLLYLWILYSCFAQEPSASNTTNRSSGFGTLHIDFSSRLWRTIFSLVLSTIVVIVLILPWTVRNYFVFGDFVPVNTNTGFAFFWGNHPIYGTDFSGILPSGGPSYYDLIPPELRSLNEAELDRALLKRGIGFVVEDPLRIALLSLSRVGEYFKFWPSAESSMLSNIARVASFGLALPFIVSGLWLAFTSVWKTASGEQRRGAVLLVLFASVYSLIHLLTWALIRYRLPVDAVLLVFAGLSAERAATWLFSKTGRQRKQVSADHAPVG